MSFKWKKKKLRWKSFSSISKFFYFSDSSFKSFHHLRLHNFSCHILSIIIYTFILLLLFYFYVCTIFSERTNHRSSFRKPTEQGVMWSIFSNRRRIKDLFRVLFIYVFCFIIPFSKIDFQLVFAPSFYHRWYFWNVEYIYFFNFTIYDEKL